MHDAKIGRRLLLCLLGLAVISFCGCAVFGNGKLYFPESGIVAYCLRSNTSDSTVMAVVAYPFKNELTSSAVLISAELRDSSDIVTDDVVLLPWEFNSQGFGVSEGADYPRDGIAPTNAPVGNDPDWRGMIPLENTVVEPGEIYQVVIAGHPISGKLGRATGLKMTYQIGKRQHEIETMPLDIRFATKGVSCNPPGDELGG